MPEINHTEQNTIPENKWYKDIYELPLSVFENCMLNDNGNALSISGNPTQKELTDAWENILQEYSDAMGNSEYRMYVNLYKEVELLRIDYECVNLLVGTLRKVYIKELCDDLNKLLRQQCKFDVNNLEQFLADLDKCERRGKALKINLDLKVLELESIREKATGGKSVPMNRNYFTSILIVLSKHNAYNITKDVFVNQYCEYMKQYTAYCDEMNKQFNKK